MKIKNTEFKLPEKVTRTVGRNVLVLKKESPHIFFGLGLAGVVTSTVLACRATLKLSDTLDEIQNDVNNMKELKSNIVHHETREYPVQEYRRDMFYVYTKSGLQLVRLYGPSVLVGIASISLLTGSHIQMTRRNQALLAAYAAVQRAYDDYRERVRGELGEEKERDIYHAAITAVDDKTKEEAKIADPNRWSPYAKFFDEGSRHWEKDSELNRLFVQCQQNFANEKLHATGHLFLNEVYDMLGIDRTKAGAVVGWVIGDEGDNYVDFGIFEAYNARFVNGWERSILLDFNVDGVIYDKI